MGKLIPFPTKYQGDPGREPTSFPSSNQMLRQMAVLCAKAERSRQVRELALSDLQSIESFLENPDDADTNFHEADFMYSVACIDVYEALRQMQHQKMFDPALFS